MKARVVKLFTDKYSLKSIALHAEIEISEERFGELTTGPRGIFVEEVKEEIKEEKPIEKKASTKKNDKK